MKRILGRLGFPAAVGGPRHHRPQHEDANHGVDHGAGAARDPAPPPASYPSPEATPSAPAATLLVSDATLFEVDNLFGYLWRHTTLSGIQRVQVNLFRHLLRTAGTEGPRGYGFVRYDEERRGFQRLDPRAVGALVDCCAGGQMHRDRLDQLLREGEESGVPVRLEAGQCFLVTGAFWDYRTMDRYLRVKAAGLSLGVVLYDLIPVDYPEFCDAWLVSDFGLALGDGFLLFDFVLTISEFSAGEIRRYLSRHGLRPVPVQVLPLAHVVTDVTPDGAGPRGDEWTEATQPLRNRPFVLCVGTIEARKNHAYLLACWKLLGREGADLPDLVFVGREGMRTRDLVQGLRATQYMDGRVHVLHDLSDGELGTLYRHCLFTAFPSFVEGWGNPPGESLAHGTPCVAAGNTAIPEGGGGFVDYVDPYNVRDGVNVFRRMVVDGEYRERRRAEIRSRFRARSWEEVTADLLDHVARLRPGPAAEGAAGPPAPLLHAGEVFRVGDLHQERPVPPNYPSRPLRLVLAEGWFPVDRFGAWTRTGDALLRFATPCAAGSEVVLHLRLRGPLDLDDAQILVSTGAADAWAKDARGAARTGAEAGPSTEVLLHVRKEGTAVVQVLARADEQGIVEARIALDGKYADGEDADGHDPGRRRLSFGIVAVGYAPRSDAAACADLGDALAASSAAP